MKSKRFILTVSAIVLAIILSESAWSQSVDNSNESKTRKFEIGGQFTALRQRSFEENSQVFNVSFAGSGKYRLPTDAYQTEYGFGGRFTYNFNKNVAVETEANYFPVDRLSRTGKESARIFNTNDFVRNFVEPQGRKFQVFIGPKIGYRRGNLACSQRLDRDCFMSKGCQ